ARSTLGLPAAFGLFAFGAVLLATAVALLGLEHRARQRIEATLAQARAQVERAQADVRRIDADMQRLAQFSDQLQSCRSLDEVNEVLNVAMQGLLPQFDGALYLQAPGRNVATRQAAWGKPQPPLD